VGRELEVSFRILGPIEIGVDGRRIALPGGHARSILGLLLLQPNRVVSTDHLIEALWRDDPPRTAQNVLQAHVVTLRRALRAGDGDGAALVTRLETHPAGYLLRVEPGELDADLFGVEVADAERLAAGAPGAATDLLRRALARWRGDIDAGGAESSAAAGAVARLEEQRLAAIEALAELNLQLGRAREVAADLEPLVREHPFRERFHALLMIALYRGGRQADALAAYRSAREALVDELGVEPGPELRALELAVLRQEPGLLGSPRELEGPDAVGADPSAGTTRRELPAIHNAPSITTSFVGRLDEMETVGKLLATERLVTITGVGGAGKTRLAVEVAALARERFPGGASFIDLTPVPDGERLQLAVAGALGIAEAPDKGIVDSIIDGIGDEPRLLILDNCEHVIEPCARLAEALLVGSPALSVLATSREPLRLGSEALWRLAPLGTEAAPALSDGTAPVPDAVRLLLDRAGRARPDRAWSDADLDAIAQICRRLDGLPLAIEMAAARLRVLEPADVLDRLDDRFRLLTDGGRTAIPRQRTLRATLDWSYELLDAADQAVLRRMSAFATAVPPAAVEAVCGGEDIDAVEAVVRLADRSLAFGTVGTDGRSRFGLLDTVREYGRVQLRASGEEEAIARRYVGYWMTFAAGALALRDEHRDEQADALEGEIGELRLALDRAHAMIGGEELALTGLLAWFWLHHSHLNEGRQLLERALSRPDGGELDRARCLCAAGAMAAMQGDAARASERFEAGLAILRRRGAVAEECVALDDRGWGLFFLGDIPGAETAFERAVLLADRADVPGLVRRANAGLCQMVVARGDVERARPLARQLMRIAGGDLWTEHLAHHFLGDVALMEGAPGEALGWYRTALELAHRMGNAVETAAELQGLAMAAAGVGDPEFAIRMNGAAEAALERVGFDVHAIASWASLLRRYLDPARASLGPGVDAIDLGGRSLSLDDAVREALERSVAIAVNV
jgi:predicted ATPase/DNA-binding SARP family transcriptional activator